MIIQPKTRGFICTTAHPLGCEQHIKQQVQYVKQQGTISNTPKNVLVIGASTGYGLASLISAAFGFNTRTFNVFFERPASGKRTASAGWYNIAAFEKLANQAGLKTHSINGDAFSHEIKQHTIDTIKAQNVKIDLVVYSLASPRRTDPDTGEAYTSVLKTLRKPFQNRTIDPLNGKMSDVTIEPANENEIAQTINVMGGHDWTLWIDRLEKNNLLANHVKTVAYSYIGPELTFPIYRDGSIGQAKAHLEQTAKQLTNQLRDIDGQAFVSVNKALVTQSSAAIPIVPLYISILFKVMKEHNLHENCIQQIYRLFKEKLYTADGSIPLDSEGRIRIDDWEMKENIQAAVAQLWTQVTEDNVMTITDLAGYRRDFFNLFGFEFDEVDYNQDVDPVVLIPSIGEGD